MVICSVQSLQDCTYCFCFPLNAFAVTLNSPFCFTRPVEERYGVLKSWKWKTVLSSFKKKPYLYSSCSKSVITSTRRRRSRHDWKPRGSLVTPRLQVYIRTENFFADVRNTQINSAFGRQFFFLVVVLVSMRLQWVSPDSTSCVDDFLFPLFVFRDKSTAVFFFFSFVTKTQEKNKGGN